MFVIFEKLPSAFAASRACIAYAGDRKRKHSGFRVAPCSARIGAKINRHLSFAGRRHFVGTGSRSSSTGAPLRALSACVAISMRTFARAALQFRLADGSYVWHLSSNSSVKIAPFGRWTPQKRGAFYLGR